MSVSSCFNCFLMFIIAVVTILKGTLYDILGDDEGITLLKLIFHAKVIQQVIIVIASSYN